MSNQSVVNDSGGVKYDSRKLRYDLIPPFALEQLALVYTYGATKYEDHNWLRGMQWSRIYAAMQRHLQAWRKGEDYDAESGCLHLASVAWGAMTLIEYFFFRKQLDDRMYGSEEEWRISEDPRWEVSSFGNVRNSITKKQRKLSTNSTGYKCFSYRVPGEGKYGLQLVHRWVAAAFWRSLEDDEIVHHRDGDRSNNCWWNLEITDQSGNMIHSHRDNPEVWAAHSERLATRLRKNEGVMGKPLDSDDSV